MPDSNQTSWWGSVEWNWEIPSKQHLRAQSIEEGVLTWATTSSHAQAKVVKNLSTWTWTADGTRLSFLPRTGTMIIACCWLKCMLYHSQFQVCEWQKHSHGKILDKDHSEDSSVWRAPEPPVMVHQDIQQMGIFGWVQPFFFITVTNIPIWISQGILTKWLCSFCG